jgi:hypothetical protein
MRNSKFAHCWQYLESGTLIFALTTVLGAVISLIATSPQDEKDEISFGPVATPQFQRRVAAIPDLF